MRRSAASPTYSSTGTVKYIGLIVGVGGFLGIGEKNVAIDMSAFEVVPYRPAAASSGANSAADNDPTHVNLKVSWTKDQLKAAPDFQYYRAPARTGNGLELRRPRGWHRGQQHQADDAVTPVNVSVRQKQWGGIGRR